MQGESFERSGAQALVEHRRLLVPPPAWMLQLTENVFAVSQPLRCAGFEALFASHQGCHAPDTAGARRLIGFQRWLPASASWGGAELRQHRARFSTPRGSVELDARDVFFARDASPVELQAVAGIIGAQDHWVVTGLEAVPSARCVIARFAQHLQGRVTLAHGGLAFGNWEAAQSFVRAFPGRQPGRFDRDDLRLADWVDRIDWRLADLGEDPSG